MGKRMRKFIMFLLLIVASIALPGPRAEAKKPTAPTELLAVTSLETSGAVELNWQAVKGVSRYTVSASRETADNWHDLGTTTATSFQVDELPEGTKYYFRVASNAPSGQSNWSGAIVQYSSKTKDFRPALLLPTNFRISSSSAVAKRAAPGRTGELALAWNVVAGARSYIVQICESEQCGTGARINQDDHFRDLAAIVGTEHLVTGLLSGKRYSFRILGIDAKGQRGSYSEAREAQTP